MNIFVSSYTAILFTYLILLYVKLYADKSRKNICTK